MRWDSFDTDATVLDNDATDLDNDATDLDNDATVTTIHPFIRSPGAL